MTLQGGKGIFVATAAIDINYCCNGLTFNDVVTHVSSPNSSSHHYRPQYRDNCQRQHGHQRREKAIYAAFASVVCANTGDLDLVRDHGAPLDAPLMRLPVRNLRCPWCGTY